MWCADKTYMQRFSPRAPPQSPSTIMLLRGISGTISLSSGVLICGDRERRGNLLMCARLMRLPRLPRPAGGRGSQFRFHATVPPLTEWLHARAQTWHLRYSSWFCRTVQSVEILEDQIAARCRETDKLTRARQKHKVLSVLHDRTTPPIPTTIYSTRQHI